MTSNDIIRNMLRPQRRKDSVINEATEEKNPTFQGLMDKAYKKWQSGELKGVSSEEFINALPENEATAVRIGNMNYQVENGGWMQWWDNGYGPRDIDYLVNFFNKHAEYSSFAEMEDLINKVKQESEQPGEEECDHCGGAGGYDEDDDESDTSTWYDCDNCRGDGTVESDIPQFSDSLDGQYYEINDALVSDVEKFLSGKTDDIEKASIEAPTEPPEEAPEEAPKEKQKPKVRLVGSDGNAFSILGKVSAALKKAGYSPEEVKEFQTDATSGDYDHLLQTAMKWADVS